MGIGNEVHVGLCGGFCEVKKVHKTDDGMLRAVEILLRKLLSFYVRDYFGLNFNLFRAIRFQSLTMAFKKLRTRISLKIIYFDPQLNSCTINLISGSIIN